MAQARLSMRKIEEVLRLKYELGRTHREIVGISRIHAEKYGKKRPISDWRTGSAKIYAFVSESSIIWRRSTSLSAIRNGFRAT